MDTCFIIQPFDNGKFDKRYEDIFRPAIEECGLSPYRVDKDNSTVIPIDSIEKGIREARVVLAEITLDNPNVWYELGYAMANKKDIIMICSVDERLTAYPFDIRHRTIIQYNTNSSSDYLKLKEDIKNKIKSFLLKKIVMNDSEHITETAIENSDEKEVALLASIMKLQYTNDEDVPAYALTEGMQKFGYNELNTSFAIRKLLSKGMLVCRMESDINGQEYAIFKLTSEGESWAIANENRFNKLNEVIVEKIKLDYSEMPF